MVEDENCEADLVARIRQADHVAFEIVFRRYYEPLCRYSQGYTKSLAVAEDVVQELFGYLWEHRAEWKPRSVKNYLYAAVRNRSINAANHSRRHVGFDKNTATLRVKNSADRTMQQEDLQKQVEHALSHLSDRQREVFYLSRNAGCSHKEIAAILDLSVHTVETHMVRALKKLHERLKSGQHSCIHVVFMLASCFV